MKKKLLALIPLAGIMIAALTGCQAGLVNTDLTMYSDGSGTTTIAVEVLGDNSVIPGTENNESPSTVGNNSKFLLIGGDELAAKIKSYSALEDVEVTADVNGEDTVITLTYEFDSIDDYNAKTKTLAKDRAEDIVDATFTDNGDGTYTLREWADNAENTVYNIFESLFNDPEAFDPTGAGDLDLTQPQYGVKEIFKIMTVSVTLGDDTQTETLFEYDNSGTGSGNVTDYPDWVEVTGTPAEKGSTPAPGPGDEDEQPGGETEEPSSGLSTGAIVGIVIAAVVVVAAIVAVVVVISKKNGKKEN